MEADEPSSGRALPRLQLLRQPAAAAAPAAAPSAADTERPSAWSEAFEEASLLSSPMAAASYGRGLPFGKPSPPRSGEVWVARHDESANGAASGVKWGAVRTEARNLCRLALPMSVTNLCSFLIGMVALGVAGRLGQFELSAIVLGTSIFNVTGLSLIMGFAAAMETFCGQAYGARQYAMVGVVFQRALILTTGMSAGIALLWTQAEPLLLFFRQDPLISRAAARYIQLATPALWATGTFEACKRYLLAQGVVRPQSAVTVVGLALAPLYSWLLIFRLDLRLDGAAYAVNAIQLTMVALLGGYIVLRDAVVLKGLPHATWHGWTLDALRGWRTYLRFALPSVVMICSEWWTFEVMIIFSGWLARPDVSVGTMGVAINTSGVVWMFVTGFAMACSTRVSTSLGAGCPRTAQRAAWTAVGITSLIELAAMVAVLALRRKWAYVFTSAPDVIELTASIMPIFALSLPGDGANATLQGLLRGSGRQGTGALTNLASYWAVGIPSAYYLAFKRGLGVHGLWWGLVITNTVQGSLMLLIAARFDFAREAHKAAARVRAQQQHHHHQQNGLAAGSSGALFPSGSSSILVSAEAAEGRGEGLEVPLLLDGPQCERLEQGLLAPQGPPGGEEDAAPDPAATASAASP